MSVEVSTPSFPTQLPTEAEPDAAVHAAGTHQKPSFRWQYFLALNAIAGVIAVAIFMGIGHADSLDPFMAATYEWLLNHPMATSAMAFSPLVSCGLVGWGYSQRARKRKAAVLALSRGTSSAS